MRFALTYLVAVCAAKSDLADNINPARAKKATRRAAPAPSPPPLQAAVHIVAKEHLRQLRPACGAEAGIFWQYGDLPRNFIDGVETAQECCELCDDHPECDKWSFGLIDPFRKRCYIKKTHAYAEPRNHFISGYATVRGSRPEDGEL